MGAALEALARCCDECLGLTPPPHVSALREEVEELKTTMHKMRLPACC